MEELIFFGLIIFFAILDGIARKRRVSQKTPPVPSPGDWEPLGDPDRDGIPGQPRPEYSAPYGSSSEAKTPPRSSETMVPDDIWREIEALARGERPAPEPPRPAPRPKPEFSYEEESRLRDEAAFAARPAPKPPRAWGRPVPSVHAVHRSHAGYGTDPSSRAPATVTGSREELRPEARAARALLAGGADSLRTAVVLKEVLGPPVSMRD